MTKLTPGCNTLLKVYTLANIHQISALSYQGCKGATKFNIMRIHEPTG